MEIVLLSRLTTFCEQIKVLTSDALNLCNALDNNKGDEAKIVASKLRAILDRFNEELYNYFRLSVEPDADVISELTSHQLQGDQILAELETKLKIITESTPMLPTKENHSAVTLSGKLPKLNLPEFAGDVLEWHQFWDQFCSNIDKRNLPDVDKLLYLKASLKGQAAKIVEGLDTTNANYKIAVTSLKERYGRESLIIDAHYSALYKVKPATNTGECRKTLNDIERHLRVLTSLGENANQNHLRFMIIEKFPEEIVYEMKLKIKCDSIQEIRTELEKIISAKEDAKRISKENKSEPSEYTVKTLHTREYNIKRGSASTGRNYEDPKISTDGKNKRFRKDNMQSTTRNKRKSDQSYKPKRTNSDWKRPKISCIFCNQGHYNDECRKFTTTDARKNKLKNRCFNCLKQGHNSNQCNKKKKCFHCGTYGNHNRAICPKKFPVKSETNAMHIKNEGKLDTVLQTAVVNIKRAQGSKSIKCRVLLDSGSQRTYMTQEIADHLNLPIEENNRLSVFTFGSNKPQEIESPLVQFEMETRTNKIKNLYANVVPTISQGVPYPEKVFTNWNDKNKYIMADDGSLSDRIDILIGNDYYYSLISTTKLEIGDNLFLVESELGWILSGKATIRPIDQLSAITYFQSSCEVRLNQPDPPIDNGNLKLLWDLESIGIVDSPKLNRDEEAIKNFNENTKFEGNRYYVSWPWNEYPPNLPSNFGLAFGRLVSLMKRLDSTSLALYDQTLKEQLKLGIIEMVPSKDKVYHPVHYMPHHGVSAPGKPIRIVYDASAKLKDNNSLNQCLYCGPVMLEDLTGLLLKFRCHPIGISADVEKAFLQIGLQERDRDVTRFLWLKDITKAATEDNLLQLRFTRVPFGIISSPFLLNATIKHHLLNSQDDTIKQIASDIYVDNLVTGTKTTLEATDLYTN